MIISDFQNIFEKEIKKLNKKIQDLSYKFKDIADEHELLLDDIAAIDNRLIILENINNIDNNDEGELFRSQVSQKPKAKKERKINEKPISQRQISKEKNKSKKKEDTKKIKNSKEKETKTSIFFNDINTNNNKTVNKNNIFNINDNNTDITKDNLSQNYNSLIINDNSNDNFDIMSFGRNGIENDNNSVLSTSVQLSEFSFNPEKLVNQINKSKNKKQQQRQQQNSINNNIPSELQKNNDFNKLNFRKNVQINENIENIINSEIIKNFEEFNLIITSLPGYNKFDDFPSSQIIFQSSLDGDSAKKFHKFCDGEPNILVIVESNDGGRFGGYTKLGFSSDGEIKYDDTSFLFSLDKMKVFKVKKRERTINCDPNSGPFFGDRENKGILISDNYLKENSFVGSISGYYYNMSQDYELNNGKKEFIVKKLEILKLLI